MTVQGEITSNEVEEVVNLSFKQQVKLIFCSVYGAFCYDTTSLLRKKRTVALRKMV